ncbi:YbaB/EbfC family nucleoid-associated protein [Streptomyces catenulae]|uniref:YbaB/EbfC family nucleoid-associated protein n=1 Tax=Streptomyces catenulae TaxID=66875 RepID=A0ABV2YYX0_9ACTN|nr:YbaB/EbfC family nucleoid-associated protein [Streptomyces catenulae]
MADSPSFDIAALTRRMRDLQGNLAGLGGLKDSEMTGHARGGLVTAKVDADGMLTSLRVDPSVIDPEDPQSLEEMVVTAVAAAQSTLREMRKQQVGEFTEGMLSLADGLRTENRHLRASPLTDPQAAGFTAPVPSAEDGPGKR